jgi:homeobox-leucine zipper protein
MMLCLYRFHFGDELIKSVDANSSNESILKAVWHHPSAILCCSLKVSSAPFFSYLDTDFILIFISMLIKLLNCIFRTKIFI